MTPLHLASEPGHLGLARFLVDHGANPAAKDQRGRAPLPLASEWGHLDLARFLVEHGRNAEAQDQDPSTPPHLASKRDRLSTSYDPSLSLVPAPHLRLHYRSSSPQQHELRINP